MGLLDSIINGNKEKKELAWWIVAHNTYEYLGVYPMAACSYETCYFDYDIYALVELKAKMQGLHHAYEHRKAHPKPKIGDTYKVYICGNLVDTLRNVTNVSSNQNGAFFTITNEDGSTRLKEYFGNGNIHWTRG